MSRIRNKDTGPELALWHILKENGYHFRMHDSKLVGNPDFVLSQYRLVIFVDGEFWHGRFWKDKKKQIRSNREYWIPKIERNMKRDRRNRRLLRMEGWKVVRFWGTDLIDYPERCLSKIIRTVEAK